MSQNMLGRNNSFTVFVGSLETITVIIQDNAGNAIDLTSTSTYNSVKLNVWTPDGTLIINAAGAYGTRNLGQVQYTFASGDTVDANAGNWEGIFICYDNSSPTPKITQYSDIFNITIKQVGAG